MDSAQPIKGDEDFGWFFNPLRYSGRVWKEAQRAPAYDMKNSLYKVSLVFRNIFSSALAVVGHYLKREIVFTKPRYLNGSSNQTFIGSLQKSMSDREVEQQIMTSLNTSDRYDFEVEVESFTEQECAQPEELYLTRSFTLSVRKKTSMIDRVKMELEYHFSNQKKIRTGNILKCLGQSVIDTDKEALRTILTMNKELKIKVIVDPDRETIIIDPSYPQFYINRSRL